VKELDRTNELEEQVQRLTGEVDEMRARMARLERDEPAHQNGTEPKNRRGFLKFGAGAVMGALGMAAAKVIPAAAATGGNLILGNPNAAGATTNLTGDTTVTAVTGPNPTLQVQAANFSSTKLSAALAGPPASTLQGAVQALGGDFIAGPPAISFEGIDAFATGATAWGVYGLTDSGTGVVGESNTGIGLYARRSGRIRQEPRALAGKPNYSANDVEQVRDSNGDMWISVPVSVNAVGWKRLATFELFPNPRRIYDGYVQPTGPGTYGPIDATAQVSTSNWPGGVSGVPAGARHAFCAVQSYNAGVMTLFPDLTADTNVANWSGTANGPLNLTYVLVPLSPAGKFKIHTYFTGQIFIDVWGFYM
jgi:hypothetical protein